MPHPKLLSSLSQISFSFPIRIVPIFGESFFPRSIYTISKIFDFVGYPAESHGWLRPQKPNPIPGRRERMNVFIVSIPNEFKKEREISELFEIDLTKSYNLKGWVWEWVWTGWAPGMDFRGQVWKRGCEKWHFLKSKIGSGFGEPGGTPPPIIPTGWIFINFAT